MKEEKEEREEKVTDHFPTWKYHKDHEPKLVKSKEELEALPGGHEAWHDNPGHAGLKLEVRDVGTVQKVMRKVEKHEAPAAPIEPFPFEIEEKEHPAKGKFFSKEKKK